MPVKVGRIDEAYSLNRGGNAGLKHSSLRRDGFYYFKR
jgi:hypothetical protein